MVKVKLALTESTPEPPYQPLNIEGLIINMGSQKIEGKNVVYTYKHNALSIPHQSIGKEKKEKAT